MSESLKTPAAVRQTSSGSGGTLRLNPRLLAYANAGLGASPVFQPPPLLPRTPAAPSGGAQSGQAAQKQKAIPKRTPAPHGSEKPAQRSKLAVGEEVEEPHEVDLARQFQRLQSPTKGTNARATPSVPRNQPSSNCLVLYQAASSSTPTPPQVRHGLMEVDTTTLASSADTERTALAPSADTERTALAASADTERTSAPSRAPRRAPAGARSVQESFPLKVSGGTLTRDEFFAIKNEQRSSQNYWKQSWAFPDGSETRTSYRRCCEFICYGCNQCTVGDCLSYFDTSDVQTARKEAAAQVERAKLASTGASLLSLADVYHTRIATCWNGACFRPISVFLTPHYSVEICVTAYALLIGMKGSSVQSVLQDIKAGRPVPDGTRTFLSRSNMSRADTAKRASLDHSLLVSYVRVALCKAHEHMNTAPGAARNKEAVMTDKSRTPVWVCYE